ncbi:predicted protein [Uncinocarpus reesii 1704]|uniref:HRQ family protein 2 n=1 Tax=Uncinocarpus reesii (strain UAMH 1704) TaxID=336963 RepID=C4JZ20_UNCRE|nr:uncharacterized protein UREG_07421 [Uncinocarpus reesii 1704]EEP82556.1 predicted protein [Uncinocarpus reesii 1704]
MGQPILAGLDMIPYWSKMTGFFETSRVKPVNILMLVGLLAVIWGRRWAEVQRAKKARKILLESGANFPEIEPLEEFEWEKTEPLQLRPYKPKYHLTMALENLDPSELIPMDNTYKERIDLRRRLLKEHRDVVLGVNKDKSGEEDPRTRAAVSELYEFVLGTYLPTRYPKMFKLVEANFETGKTILVRNQVTGEMLPTTLNPNRPTITALETLAKTVDEEMLILLPEIKASNHSEKTSEKRTRERSKPRSDPSAPDGEGNRYVLEAYTTCFPSGFDTRTKLGKRLDEIHIPVPGYKQKLEKSMDRFFDKLEVGKFVKRANWTLTTDADLFAAFGGIHGQQGECMKPLEELDLDNTFLRCERQTLYRLPTSGALVFSFHTYRYPIQQIKDEGSAEDLALAIDGFEAGNVPLMARYKRVPAWGEAVKEYLRS